MFTRTLTATTAACALLAPWPARAQTAPRAPSALAPNATPLELGLAGYAKVLCSAVFVSGRELEEAARNSGFFFLPEGHREGVRWNVDRERKLVRMSTGTVTRSAASTATRAASSISRATTASSSRRSR